MATKHALLSASSSDRWIHCPPSARLSETYADTRSTTATRLPSEGTVVLGNESATVIFMPTLSASDALRKDGT